MPLNDFICDECQHRVIDMRHSTISQVPDSIDCPLCGSPAHRDRFPLTGYRRDQTVSDLDDRIRWGEIR